jgi:creatinine amidohydrolase/Fe(II)-dependent formamide hydrolase-like protein
MVKIELGRMTWPEAAERAKEDPYTPVIVMFSSTEQHGPHSPLNTDSFSTRKIWINAAKTVANEVKPVLTPMVPFGVEYEHMGFPGTITLSHDTMTRVAKDIVRSLYLNSGFKKFALIPGCGGQGPKLALQVTMLELYEEFGPDIVLWFGTGGNAFLTPEEISEYRKLTKGLDRTEHKWFTSHAGESETSSTLAAGNPDVDMSKAVDTDIRPEWIGLPEGSDFDWFTGLSPVNSWILPRFKERGPEVAAAGSIGLASKASSEKGKPLRELRLKGIVRFLQWFKMLKAPQGSKPKHTYE